MIMEAVVTQGQQVGDLRLGAGGSPIKWEISTELGAKGIRQLFDLPINSALKNVEVVYVPQIKIIP